MAKIKITDIEFAFDFVNSDGFGERSAAINRETGEMHLSGDSLDFEEPEEEFDENNEALVWVPDKYELDLGTDLVYRFAAEFCTDEDYQEIRFFFSRRGAYAHFKRLLEKRELLDKWFDFEFDKTREALLEWCREKEIEIE